MLLWYVSVLLFSNLLFTAQCLPLCHDRERILLLKFKQSFSINESASGEPFSYPKTQSWGSETSDCCSWDGVECNNETRQVIGLDLTSSFLHGSLDSNSTLFELVHLQSLRLADNYFNNSPIPSSFEYLPNLTHLDLSYSAFTGQVPFEISQLSKLSSLDLSLNSLRLENPDFESLIRNLTKLEELSLTNVDISSTVPHSLTNFSSLRSLFLRDCGLRGEFPALVFKLPNLQMLSVRFNRFLSGKWPSFNNHSSSLEELLLAETDFSGELPSSIEQYNSLSILDISDCKFSGSIPWSLGKLNQLEFLDLSNNRLRGQISLFKNLTQLEYLSLSNTDFSNGTLSWVGNTSLTKLVYLDLANSSLVGTVPPSFSNLVNLQTINLGYNYLRGRVDFDIFLSLKNLSNIDLSENRLEVITRPSINKSLPQFKVLTLKSCNLKLFPDFLKNQQRLEWLDLSDNQISGQIPRWMLNVSISSLKLLFLHSNFLVGFEELPIFLPWLHLKILSFSHNMLNCDLPIPPKSTVFFDVSYNNLIGKVSPLICKANSLVHLGLPYNKLDGELPQCLGNFSDALLSLDLSHNSFAGEIPQTFLQTNNLIYIDLSNNQFEGKLPRSLANCRMLEYLAVGNNQLNDVFPFWLGSLPELRVLVLTNNTFHGNIGDPPANSEFSKLRIFDLSKNSFTGKLPSKYINSWKAMKDSSTVNNSGYMWSTVTTDENDIFSFPYSVTITIKGIGRSYNLIQNALATVDFSNNKFSGQIPEAFAELKGLHSLDLSNNNLTGAIPSSFGNLSELESLDISRNMLVGPIPHELTNLNFLQYFNVSHNKLVGPIPQENQLSRFDNSSYEGNLGLCGLPLSNKCGNHPEDSAEPSSAGLEKKEEEDWLDFGWRVVAIGYACGFVAGVLLGKLVLSRKPRWFSMIYRVRI